MLMTMMMVIVMTVMMIMMMMMMMVIVMTVMMIMIMMMMMLMVAMITVVVGGEDGGDDDAGGGGMMVMMHDDDYDGDADDGEADADGHDGDDGQNDAEEEEDGDYCLWKGLQDTLLVELASRVTVGGLILHSAMKSGLGVIHDVKTTYWFDVFQNAARMKKVTSPVFIIHGTHDNEIPFDHGLTLFDACPEEYGYDPWWVKEAGHNDIEVNHRSEYFDQLRKFLKWLDQADRRAAKAASGFSEDATSEMGWQPLLGSSNNARRMGLGGTIYVSTMSVYLFS
eukprot:s350_g1.t3